MFPFRLRHWPFWLAFGLVAASGVCLPSLYFYCLLAGVRMTMVEVVQLPEVVAHYTPGEGQSAA